MKFNGFQKLTLLDFPGKVACVVFTAGCNFRCPFCHNGDLVTGEGEPQELSKQEIFDFLKKRQGVLDGVVITGGEPLLHADLPEFIQEVRALGYAVKLDTNGYLPDRLQAVVASGLVDMVAMDVKNAPEKYAETTGLASVDVERIKESIAFLLSADIDVEFRTTVVKELHSPQDIVGAARMIQGAKKYFLQNFRPSETVICDGLSAFSSQELQGFLQKVREIVPNAQIRGE